MKLLLLICFFIVCHSLVGCASIPTAEGSISTTVHFSPIDGDGCLWVKVSETEWSPYYRYNGEKACKY